MEQDLLNLIREEHKLATSKKHTQMGNVRSGRRPMSVDTLLRKEKEGTLYKHTEAIKKAEQESGVELPGTLQQLDRKKRKRPSAHLTPLNHTPTYPDTNETDKAHFTPLTSLGKEAEEKAISYSEASQALKDLKKLEKKKMTTEDIGRAATAGAITSGVATPIAGLMGGGVQSGFREGYKVAPRAGISGVAKGVAAGSGKVMRGLAGAATGSAIFGAALPLVQQALARRAEKEKLREYLGTRPGTSLRRQITRNTGV